MNDKSWKSFADEYPKDYCGVLIIIKDPKSEYLQDNYDVKDQLYYGYSVKGRIQIILNITKQTEISWKASNSCALEDMYWYYDETFSCKPKSVDQAMDIALEDEAEQQEDGGRMTNKKLGYLIYADYKNSYQMLCPECEKVFCAYFTYPEWQNKIDKWLDEKAPDPSESEYCECCSKKEYLKPIENLWREI